MRAAISIQLHIEAISAFRFPSTARRHAHFSTREAIRVASLWEASGLYIGAIFQAEIKAGIKNAKMIKLTWRQSKRKWQRFNPKYARADPDFSTIFFNINSALKIRRICKSHLALNTRGKWGSNKYCTFAALYLMTSIPCINRPRPRPLISKSRRF